MNGVQVTLWLKLETPMARFYCKHGRENPADDDFIWIPKSVVEHTSKMGDQHIVTLPEWFVQKEKI